MNAQSSGPNSGPNPSDYAYASPLDWAEYEFATIEYDYKIHPDASKRIRAIFKQLSEVP